MTGPAPRARELEADVRVPAALREQRRVAADEAPVGVEQIAERRPPGDALPVRLARAGPARSARSRRSTAARRSRRAARRRRAAATRRCARVRRSCPRARRRAPGTARSSSVEERQLGRERDQHRGASVDVGVRRVDARRSAGSRRCARRATELEPRERAAPRPSAPRATTRDSRACAESRPPVTSGETKPQRAAGIVELGVLGAPARGELEPASAPAAERCSWLERQPRRRRAA